MTLRFFKFSALLLSISFVFSFCTKEDTITPIDPVVPTDNLTIIKKYLNLDFENLPNYAAPVYPKHYDLNVLANDNAPSLNKVSDAGAALGRVLFYDKNLSRNGTVACATCHIQNKGFTDERQFSQGFEGGLTPAHSMRLANANFYTGERMFWDKRAEDLEDQVRQPILNPVEMGFDDAHGGLDSLIRKMNKLEYYPALFEETFGSSEITEENIRRAMAQFVRSIVSTDSKFDQGFAQVFNPTLPGAGAGQPFPNFTQQENRGKMLFTAGPPQGLGCAGCHNPPTFALAPNSLSNGLDAGETIIFKAPSLKNIGVTGPYMHDGRFATLAQVVEHYNSGIQDGPALDNRLKNPPGTPNAGQPLRFNLTNADKDALVAFLNTLTDNTLMADSKFADPFK